MLKCFITILLAVVPSVPSLAATVVGKIENLAAKPAVTSINRYSGRESVARTETGNESPTPVAVVYLTGGARATVKPPAQHPEMVQKDQSFYPEVLPITVGTTVDFPNLDPVFHNVFSYSKAKKFDLGRYPKGHSKSVTFDTPGLVKVFCEIHSTMRAHILVLEQPYYAIVAPDGSFRIPGVPAGDYKLKIWQEIAPEIERDLHVTAADSVLVGIN